MTLFRDELSQLRNGLIGGAVPVYRFRVGERVHMLGTPPEVSLHGKVLARRRHFGKTGYKVKWEIGGEIWSFDEELEAA